MGVNECVTFISVLLSCFVVLGGSEHSSADPTQAHEVIHTSEQPDIFGWGLPFSLVNISDMYPMGGAELPVVDGTSLRQVLQTTATPPPSPINFFQWRVTLPTGVPGNPDDIYGNRLAALNNTFVQQMPTGILFMSPTSDCVTTPGTRYCRTELREMTLDGQEASWGIGDMKQHTMTVRQEVRWLSAITPRVVVAQIHGGPDDVVEVRCRGTATNPPGNTTRCAIEVFHNTIVFGVLDPSYTLNTPYTLTLSVTPRGTVSVYYTKGDTYTSAVLCGGIPQQASGAYFKTGAYTQSNETGSSMAVFLSSVDVQHIDFSLG